MIFYNHQRRLTTYLKRRLHLPHTSKELMQPVKVLPPGRDTKLSKDPRQQNSWATLNSKNKLKLILFFVARRIWFSFLQYCTMKLKGESWGKEGCCALWKVLWTLPVCDSKRREGKKSNQSVSEKNWHEFSMGLGLTFHNGRPFWSLVVLGARRVFSFTREMTFCG